MLTRESLAAMDEKSLREEVLVPLFEAMGFHDVAIYHGGVLEKGKDIVMWKEDDLGQRKDYAVVAKAAKITGSVSGKNSFNEVSLQVVQAFASSYVDPNDGTPRDVKEAFVVLSRPVRKEAMTALMDSLRGTTHEHHTMIIGRDRLWDLVEKHLPAAMWETMDRAKDGLRRVTPDGWLLAATVGPEGTSLSLRIDPSSHEHPLETAVRGALAFPTTPEGLRALDGFKKAIETGNSYTLDGRYIKELAMPEALAAVFRDLERPSELRMEPVIDTAIHQLEAEFQAVDGQLASLGVLNMRRVRSGTHQATLANDGQDVAWKVNLTLSWATSTITFHWAFTALGVNVYQALRAFQFLEAQSKGGRLLVRDHNTGMPFLETTVAPGTVPAPPPLFVRALADAVLIQERARVALNVPKDGITQVEARTLAYVADIIRTGRAELRQASVTGTVVWDRIDEFLEHFSQGRTQTLRVTERESATVLGTEIDLGDAVISCPRGRVAPKDLARIEEAIAKKRKPRLVVRFENEPGSTWIAEYPRWQGEDTNPISDSGS